MIFKNSQIPYNHYLFCLYRPTFHKSSNVTATELKTSVVVNLLVALVYLNGADKRSLTLLSDKVLNCIIYWTMLLLRYLLWYRAMQWSSEIINNAWHTAILTAFRVMHSAHTALQIKDCECVCVGKRWRVIENGHVFDTLLIVPNLSHKLRWVQCTSRTFKGIDKKKAIWSGNSNWNLWVGRIHAPLPLNGISASVEHFYFHGFYDSG